MADKKKTKEKSFTDSLKESYNTAAKSGLLGSKAKAAATKKKKTKSK